MKQIYCLINLENDKKYVGQTRQKLHKRFLQHCKANTVIGKALQKYGIYKFVCVVLATTDCEKELNLLEKHYIEKLNTVSPSGYNRTTGGDNYNFSTDLKEYLSVVHKTRKRNPHSEETKAKLALTSKGNKNRLGKTNSTEMKMKSSISLRGKNAKLTEIEVLEIRDLLADGISLSVIAKNFNISTSSISDIKEKRTWKHL